MLLGEQRHDGVNSLPKTVTRQRRDCDLNPGPTAPESSTLTTRLPSHPTDTILHLQPQFLFYRPSFQCDYLLQICDFLLKDNLRLITTAARFHTDCIRHSVHRLTVSEHGHELMPVKLVSDGVNGNKNILRQQPQPVSIIYAGVCRR